MKIFKSEISSNTSQ